MDKLTPHWTESSTAAFVHRISFDFVTQIQKRLDQAPRISKKQFARVLGVTPSRVSQVLNNPANLELATAVEYAKGAGMKVALIAYDDGDRHNQNGPINSEIFEQCWKLQGSPSDFFDLSSTTLSSCRVSMFHRTASNEDKYWKTMPISAQQLLTYTAATDRIYEIAH